MTGDFLFGAALGSIFTIAGVFLWCLVSLRRPTDFDQYEVE